MRISLPAGPTRQMASCLAWGRDDRRRDIAGATRYSRRMIGRHRDSETSGSSRSAAIAAALIPR
jgi:hypothetical protein